MTGAEKSTGRSAVKNNWLSQLPLEHSFILLVLRVPEIEIPLSVLSTSFCQQAGKEENKNKNKKKKQQTNKKQKNVARQLAP